MDVYTIVAFHKSIKNTNTYQVPGTYQVRPHLIPETGTDVAYSLANYQSVRKPIDAVLFLSRPFLKALMLVESMMRWSRRFQRSTTRSQKKWRLKSRRHLFLMILAVWPLVLSSLFSENMLSKLIVDHPLYIRNTSNKSARLRLSKLLRRRSFIISFVYCTWYARRIWKGDQI